MIRTAIPLLLLLCLIACRAPGEIPPPPAPGASAPAPVAVEPAPEPLGRVRLAQVFVSKARSDEELREEMRAIRATGANVVVVRAFHLRGDSHHGLAREGAPGQGIYFRSAGSPLVADLLPACVEAAHAEGLRVWAWMTTRRCPWLLDASPEMAGYRREDGRVLRTQGVDLFNPESLTALERLYRDLGSTGVDGILFQDDLVLRGHEGLGPHAAREAGERPPLGAPPREWYERRARWLVQVGERMLAAAREGAGREISGGWNVYYDELWVPDLALEWLSRDVRLAAAAGFDYLVVMAYHRQVGRELDLEKKELRVALATMAQRLEMHVSGEPERAVVKLQAVSWKTGKALGRRELRWAAEPWLEVAPFSLGIARIEALEGIRFEDLETEAATP